MKDYQSIRGILDNIENLLDSLLISGVGIIREDELKEFERLEADCSRIGLGEASKLLLKIRESLVNKRHKLHYDSTEISKYCCVLGSYIGAVRSKIKLDMVEEKLSGGEEVNSLS